MVSPLKRRPSSPTGVEVWVVGDRAELAVVRAQLGAVGQLVETSTPNSAGAGRFRQYLRLTVSTSS